MTYIFPLNFTFFFFLNRGKGMQEQGCPSRDVGKYWMLFDEPWKDQALPTPPGRRVDLHLPARHHLTNNFLKFFPPAIMPLETYSEIEFSVTIQVQGFTLGIGTGKWNRKKKAAERVEVEKLWSRETAEWPCLPPRILNTVVLLIQLHWVHWDLEEFFVLHIWWSQLGLGMGVLPTDWKSSKINLKIS